MTHVGMHTEHPYKMTIINQLAFESLNANQKSTKSVYLYKKLCKRSAPDTS